MAAYKSFRIHTTRNAGGSSGYVTINEWKMFQEEDASGPNVLSGGVASASGSYAANTQPINAFDGNTSTFWESSNSLPNWLQYDLPEAVEVRSIYILSIPYPGERPNSFTIQGSNDDGATWDELAVIEQFFTGTATNRTASIVRSIAGRSILDDGSPALLVRIHDWNSGSLISQLVPDDEGYWGIHILHPVEIMVIHLPPEGYRPLVDGPISLKPKW